MKKLLIVLLILSVILSGCGVKINAPDAEGQSTGPSPTDETFTVIEKDEAVAPTEPVYAQQPMAAVSLPVITELTTAEDGMVVAQSRYQNIHLYVQDQQIADMVIIDFLNRLDTHTAAASALAEEAQQVYSGPYGWSSYLYETIYTPTRIDLSVLSLYGQNVIFTGSNHPQVECSAANYNMITGEVLTLGSILTGVDAADALCQIVIDQMALTADESRLFDDYPQIVQHRFAREESYDEDWFFTSTGLNFYFVPYEVAPYTSGVITVEVPYTLLTGIISDDFFPAESDHSEGAVMLQRLEEVDIQNYTQIAEVCLDTGGDILFLSCSGLIRNVLLESCSVDEGTGTISDETAVFAANTLSPGDGITVQTVLNEASPVLRLSYQSGEDTVSEFIVINSTDGSISLTDKI